MMIETLSADYVYDGTVTVTVAADDPDPDPGSSAVGLATATVLSDSPTVSSPGLRPESETETVGD